jgi:ABC-2 type transport system ATP-binding protein
MRCFKQMARSEVWENAVRAKVAHSGYPPTHMLVLEKVSKTYGPVRAATDVSLALSPGQVTGLLGPNGAGKSTLIKIMTTLLAPTAGRASVCGFDTVDASSQARASLGYLPEFAPLYGEMTPRQYLGYRAELCGVPRGIRKSCVDRAIERCWLQTLQHRPISKLSKGYRQRVGLASAIVHDPPVLILDEPSTGLDPTQIVQMRLLLRELAQEKARNASSPGRVVLLSSHILPEVDATADRIVMLAGGRVRVDGDREAIVQRHAFAGGHACQAQVEFDGAIPPERLQQLTTELAGAGFVVQSQGTVQLLSHSQHARDDVGLRQAIAQFASERGVLITRLQPVRPTLEDVFARVTAIAGDDEASSASAAKETAA